MSTRFSDLPPALAGTLAATRDAGAGRVPPICPFGTAGQGAVQLLPGRVHETTGSARATFAVALAGAVGDGGQGHGSGQAPQTVIWIRPSWAPDRLHPDGMRPFADPGRFLFVDAPRDADLLWCMEEALRSGQPALVVADLPAIPGLTAVRRLTLAAEAGATEVGGGGRRPPTGLILTPGAGGAPGVETRWRMDTDHGADHAWRVERLRARMAPPAAFRVVPGRDGRLALAPAPAVAPAQDGGPCPPGARDARLPPEVFGQG